MQATDLWGRTIVNDQASRVIIPTTDLVIHFLEYMKMATNLHVDWPQLGREAVEVAQSYERLVKLHSRPAMPLPMVSDESVEELAFSQFVLGLAHRLYQIGFYSAVSPFIYLFEEFVGDDMALRCHVYLPMPGEVRAIEPNDRMRIASLFQGH